ncbi:MULTISPECIES: hypothetical protein [Halorussus]|uniref:hypothetical protein n=1 Tax=Halorussus TaxID=1070314 RepID=UPI00209D6841|nr:hypothetical protein [Halorussus vallis]USZ75661.1 hypothetical protein NGM07_19810 [Halorussus vallis]USZ75716.1 hypothetical protein NGM07_20090 [Halorussus vallis]USZ75734.1 hypothetical protein NGM07_00035 [Halorussus vallis]
MPAWDASTVLATSKTFGASETVSASVDGYHTPAVCVALEGLNGNADDTITIEIVGDAGTYDVDSRTLNATGSYVVDVPQADTVQLTSANGTTISAEVRNNPR